MSNHMTVTEKLIKHFHLERDTDVDFMSVPCQNFWRGRGGSNDVAEQTDNLFPEFAYIDDWSLDDGIMVYVNHSERAMFTYSHGGLDLTIDADQATFEARLDSAMHYYTDPDEEEEEEEPATKPVAQPAKRKAERKAKGGTQAAKSAPTKSKATKNDLPMKKAKQSRPTREEILEGIGYTPLTFPASLHVPEALRAREERANQDYVVAWVQGFWDLIHEQENDPDPRAKLAQDASAGRQRAGRARAKALPSRDQPNQISLKEAKYPAAYFTPGQWAILDMPNPHGYPSGSACGEPKAHAWPC